MPDHFSVEAALMKLRIVTIHALPATVMSAQKISAVSLTLRAGLVISMPSHQHNYQPSLSGCPLIHFTVAPRLQMPLPHVNTIVRMVQVTAQQVLPVSNSPPVLAEKPLVSHLLESAILFSVEEITLMLMKSA